MAGGVFWRGAHRTLWLLWVAFTLPKAETVHDYATHLSGEAAGSFQNSRLTTGTGLLHPFGIDHAIAYVKEKMDGFGFEVALESYRTDYAPNVISCRRGTETPNEIVILGAHLDNIPSVGRAPGANDDGSGSSALLAIAQAIQEDNARFGKTLCLEHYSGEEQGLLGSRAQVHGTVAFTQICRTFG